jgi:hypothetical protein
VASAQHQPVDLGHAIPDFVDRLPGLAHQAEVREDEVRTPVGTEVHRRFEEGFALRGVAPDHQNLVSQPQPVQRDRLTDSVSTARNDERSH